MLVNIGLLTPAFSSLSEEREKKWCVCQVALFPRFLPEAENTLSVWCCEDGSPAAQRTPAAQSWEQHHCRRQRRIRLHAEVQGWACKGVGSEWRLGVARAEFLDLLLRHNVTPFQYTPEELAEELKGV